MLFQHKNETIFSVPNSYHLGRSSNYGYQMPVVEPIPSTPSPSAQLTTLEQLLASHTVLSEQSTQCYGFFD